MTDRIAALGGELHVDSSLGHGTSVSGRLPTPTLVGMRS